MPSSLPWGRVSFRARGLERVGLATAIIRDRCHCHDSRLGMVVDELLSLDVPDLLSDLSGRSRGPGQRAGRRVLCLMFETRLGWRITLKKARAHRMGIFDSFGLGFSTVLSLDHWIWRCDIFGLFSHQSLHTFEQVRWKVFTVSP